MTGIEEKENAVKDTLSGNITYGFFFTPYFGELPKGAKKEEIFKERVRKGFRKYAFYDPQKPGEEPVFVEMSTAQNFLHGDGLPFQCVRVLLQDERLSYPGLNVKDASLLLSYYIDTDVMQMSFNFTFAEADTETLIFMHHMSGNGVPFDDGNGGKIAIKELFPALLKRIGITHKAEELDVAYHLELNEAYGYEDVEALCREQKRRLYGLLSGDEGWRHVPEELAETRTQSRWTSRDFVKLLIFGPNFITVNLNKGKFFETYLAQQTHFGTRFYGGLNPYFALRSSVAEINHGIFFAIETSMSIKAIVDRTMLHHEEYQRSEKKGSFSHSIYHTKQCRREMISTLNRVEAVKMTELGELETVVLDNQRITPIIERVKYLLELLESELDLLYQNRTNTMVTILTVVGLLLSLIGLVYSHFQTFGF